MANVERIRGGVKTTYTDETPSKIFGQRGEKPMKTINSFVSRFQMSKKTFLLIFLVMSGGLLLTGCGNAPAPGQTSVPAPLPVETQIPTPPLTLASNPGASAPEAASEEAYQVMEVSEIAEVTLKDGETFQAARPFIVFSNNNGLSFRSVYSAKLPIAHSPNKPQDASSYIPLKDLKLLQVTNTDGSPHEDVEITLTTWNGEVRKAVIESGKLRLLTEVGSREINLIEIAKIDFQPATNQTIRLEMATIENSAGEQIEAPLETLSILYLDQGTIVGLYSFATNIIPLQPGMDLPLETLKSLQINDKKQLSAKLLDGRVIKGTLTIYQQLLLLGFSQQGEFSLDLMSEVKKVTFSRMLDRYGTSKARVHLNDGQTQEVLTQTLQFDHYKWIPGIPIVNYRTYYFLEIASLKLEKTTRVLDLPTATLNLRNGKTISGKFLTSESKNQLIGMTPEGELIQFPIKKIEEIEFLPANLTMSLSPQAKITLADNHLLNLESNSIIAPARTLKLFSSRYGGDYPTTYTNKFSLTPDIEIPLSEIKSITFKGLEDHGYAIHLEKTDGSTIDGYNQCYGCFIGGLSEFGQFLIDQYRISEITFSW
jgi:hypothetical protein